MITVHTLSREDRPLQHDFDLRQARADLNSTERELVQADAEAKEAAEEEKRLDEIAHGPHEALDTGGKLWAAFSTGAPMWKEWQNDDSSARKIRSRSWLANTDHIRAST